MDSVREIGLEHPADEFINPFSELYGRNCRFGWRYPRAGFRLR